MAARDAFLKDSVLNYGSRPSPGVVKVLGEVCGCQETGSMMKELADSRLYMKAIFKRDALDAFQNSYDDSFNSPPEWNHALLLLNQYQVLFQHSTAPVSHTQSLKYQVLFQHSTTSENEDKQPRFVLLIERFTLADINEGFYSKHRLYDLMADPEVRRKASELEKLHNQLASREVDMTSSEGLTQLLEELGKSSIAVDSCSQHAPVHADDHISAQDSSCLHRSLEEACQVMLSLSLADFLISSQEQAMLDALPEWKADYNPPGEGSSSDGLASDQGGDSLPWQGRNPPTFLTDVSTMKSQTRETLVLHDGHNKGACAEEPHQQTVSHSANPIATVCASTQHYAAKGSDSSSVHDIQSQLSPLTANGEESTEKSGSKIHPVYKSTDGTGGTHESGDKRVNENAEDSPQDLSEESLHHHPSVSFTCSSPDDLECLDASARSGDWHQITADVAQSISTPINMKLPVSTGAQQAGPGVEMDPGGHRATSDVSPESTLEATQEFPVICSQGFSPSHLLSQDLLPNPDGCQAVYDADADQEKPDNATDQVISFIDTAHKAQGMVHSACEIQDQADRRRPVNAIPALQDEASKHAAREGAITHAAQSPANEGCRNNELFDQASVEMVSLDCLVLQSTQKTRTDSPELEQLTPSLSPIEKDVAGQIQRNRAKLIIAAGVEEEDHIASVGKVLVHDSGSEDDLKSAENAQQKHTTEVGSISLSIGSRTVSPDTLVSDTSQDSIVIVSSDTEQTDSGTSPRLTCQDVIVILSPDDNHALDHRNQDTGNMDVDGDGDQDDRTALADKTEVLSAPVTRQRSVQRTREQELSVSHQKRGDQRQPKVHTRKRKLSQTDSSDKSTERAGKDVTCSSPNLHPATNPVDKGVSVRSKWQRLVEATRHGEERTCSSLADQTPTPAVLNQTLDTPPAVHVMSVGDNDGAACESMRQEKDSDCSRPDMTCHNNRSQAALKADSAPGTSYASEHSVDDVLCGRVKHAKYRQHPTTASLVHSLHFILSGGVKTVESAKRHKSQRHQKQGLPDETVSKTHQHLQTRMATALKTHKSPEKMISRKVHHKRQAESAGVRTCASTSSSTADGAQNDGTNASVDGSHRTHKPCNRENSLEQAVVSRQAVDHQSTGRLQSGACGGHQLWSGRCQDGCSSSLQSPPSQRQHRPSQPVSVGLARDSETVHGLHNFKLSDELLESVTEILREPVS